MSSTFHQKNPEVCMALVIDFYCINCSSSDHSATVTSVPVLTDCDFLFTKAWLPWTGLGIIIASSG